MIIIFIIMCIDVSRAIYFFAYANTKSFLVDAMERETPLVHVTSAATAGRILLSEIALNERLKRYFLRN
jgi:hypothetical protein